MLFSQDLEKQVLAALIKFPNLYNQIGGIIDEKDFYSEDSVVHRTIFFVLRDAIESGQNIDEFVLSERINLLGMSFKDNINISDYIQSLSLKKIAKEKILTTVQELKKFTAKRGLFDVGIRLSEQMKNIPTTKSYQEIIDSADKIYNNHINMYEGGNNEPENIFDDMEEYIEMLGENPVEDFGMMGPHPRINELYGSLVRPGNMSVVVARSAVGKSQFCMDFCTKLSSAHNNHPILHFDNGEMSKEELIVRQCAAMTKLPVYLLETGQWRHRGYGEFSQREVIDIVRKTWKRIKDMQFHYYDTAGLDVEQMVSIARRFYYSKVGRGNEMTLSFDYIKNTFSKSGGSSWELVGQMVERFKQFIKKDICDDGGPKIGMITSVQANRSGITTNKSSSDINDDEGIIALSDDIIRLCSHCFILRKKTLDELNEEPPGFGTHKLILLKPRHLGKNVHRALEPVVLPDGGTAKNYINLNFENFAIDERGDLQDLVDAQKLANVEVSEEGREEQQTLL